MTPRLQCPATAPSPAGVRATRRRPQFDTETLAINAFKEEGAFLDKARRASEDIARRLSQSHPNVKTFQLTRAELADVAYLLSRAVAIGSEYHLDAAGPEA